MRLRITRQFVREDAAVIQLLRLQPDWLKWRNYITRLWQKKQMSSSTSNSSSHICLVFEAVCKGATAYNFWGCLKEYVVATVGLR